MWEDAGGRPHVVPMVFALASRRSGETVYSAVDAKPKRSTSLRRFANIAANPRVAVLVDHYEDDWHALWRWHGPDPGRRPARGRDAIAQLVARYPQYREQPPGGPVVAIDVARWSSWSAASD
ncbi:MAG TPA: TIGR03668 family PPOX class F420-dependent oxidoreductase [Pseudonocardiaceae bacterium]